jgi:hypothetical protein
VLLFLGHESDPQPDRSRALEHVPKGDRVSPQLNILLDMHVNREQLGRAGDQPLLRVHFRSPDRPGALLGVLKALEKTLGEEPCSLTADQWRVWHGQSHLTGGRAALTRMTLRLDIQPVAAESWDAGVFEEVDRKIRILASGQV